MYLKCSAINDASFERENAVINLTVSLSLLIIEYKNLVTLR